VLEFWSLDHCSSKSILDVLETIYLKFRKTIVQRVTVVKLGVYDGGGNYFGGVKVKVGTDTADSTNVELKVNCKRLYYRHIQLGPVMQATPYAVW